MNAIPEEVRSAWDRREAPAVLATVDGAGVPNIIYVTCVRIYDDATVLIADNYFNKTRENLRNGTKASLLFITPERKAYQLKGDVSYRESGVHRDFMRDCLDEKYPVVGVAALTVTDVFRGAERLV